MIRKLPNLCIVSRPIQRLKNNLSPTNIHNESNQEIELMNRESKNHKGIRSFHYQVPQLNSYHQSRLRSEVEIGPMKYFDMKLLHILVLDTKYDCSFILIS